MTSPPPALHAVPPAGPSEAQWVAGELEHRVVRVTANTQLVVVLVIPVYVALLWGDAPTPALLAWTLLALAVAALRFWLIRRYEQRVRSSGPVAQLEYFERLRHVWTASALVWALLVGLAFDRAPLADQFLCWLILAGLGMFAINSLSGHLPTLYSFVNTLVGVSLALVAWRVVVDLGLRAPAHHLWLMALLAAYWWVLRLAGRRLHLTQRHNHELQFRNNQLIESLTRQTQAALDAVEIKNRFMASATHDIRQPVHALGLYADWLAAEPELVHELAPKILESTKAVNALFDSLFDMARLDAGKIKLRIEPVPLEQLLHDLELQHRPLAQARGLALRIRPAAGTVLSDPILLRRIIGNLVSNAIKHTSRGGVLVAVRGAPGAQRVEVWDTGAGIAPEHQQDIFREFYKVPTHAGTEDGFGLGLYIVARLSHILGHPVRLASRPGRGTVFRLLLLPADPRLAAERAASIDRLASRPSA